jgi:hypothetical protein
LRRTGEPTSTAGAAPCAPEAAGAALDVGPALDGAAALADEAGLDDGGLATGGGAAGAGADADADADAAGCAAAMRVANEPPRVIAIAANSAPREEPRGPWRGRCGTSSC